MRVATLVAVLAFSVACSDKGPTENTPDGGDSDTDQIQVKDNSFSPSATTVPPGTTVTWTFTGANLHNVTFNTAGITGSPNQSSGTFSKTFPDAGTFSYVCGIHGLAMSGVITVE